MSWAVVKSTWKKRSRYEFIAHLEHRSAINTGLKQEGRSENCNGRRFVWSSRNVRGSSPIRCVPCVVLVFVTQINKCCVDQALAPESYRYHYLHLCLSILSILGSLNKLPTYCMSSPLPQAPSMWHGCR